MSKQKAVEVGMHVLKRMPLERVQTKNRVPLGSKVQSFGVNHRSYGEVVKTGTNQYDSKLKPRKCTTNFPVYDQKLENVDTTVTNTQHKGNAIDIVPNSVCNPVDNNANDIQDKSSNKYDHSVQECKIFYINGLDDKYLHSIFTFSCDKKAWKNANNEVTRAWRSQTDYEYGFIPLPLSELQGATSGVINRLSDYCHIRAPVMSHSLVSQFFPGTNESQYSASFT